MSSIADINGIWIADESVPVQNCGCLVRESERKGGPLQQFNLVRNVDFKLIGWVTGNEAGRRIFLKADIHKTGETLSKFDLDISNPIEISAQNKGAIQYIIWKWPKAANWKIPGEYLVNVSLGYIEGPNYMSKPKWEPPVRFTFEVINK